MGSKIDLSNGGAYLFEYNISDRSPEHKKILEDVIAEIANHLKGARYFIKEQRAELVIIGHGTDNHIYILNRPEGWALKKFSEEYRHIHWMQRRIGNNEIASVIVHNMYLTGEESTILIANNSGGASKCSYSPLIPIFLRCDTQELDTMMTELMNLNMLKVWGCSHLTWLRQQHNHLGWPTQQNKQ